MKKYEVKTIESLEFKDASFGYGHGSMIFDKMSFKLPMDGNYFVTGAAAAGQSTFLKLLSVLVQPVSGQFLINGFDTTDMSFEEFLPFRLKIGYGFDYGGLFSNRTLMDNLALPLVYHKLCSAQEAALHVEQWAQDFGFTRELGRRPAEVSGGLRKIVCVIRAFLLKPEMIVLDDPFTGLDTESSRRLCAVIERERAEGRLRHFFLTSREDTWVHKVGVQKIWIEEGGPRLITNLKKVA